MKIIPGLVAFRYDFKAAPDAGSWNKKLFMKISANEERSKFKYEILKFEKLKIKKKYWLFRSS